MEPPHLDDLRAYYARGEEVDRLAQPNGIVEFERTKAIVLRESPPEPATVADIGGGPGAYALWLAGLGYDVQHRDLVTAHVNHLQSLGIASIDTQVGDAGRLDLESGAVDAVLLLGPMYHLTGRDDRIATLREAARVSRPGGPIFIAAISRWAPRLDGGLTVWKACPSRSPILGSGSLTRSGGRSCSRLRPR